MFRLLSLLLAAVSFCAANAGITTVDILDRTRSAIPNCVDYQVIGKCFWLSCSLSGCGITTSTKVAHYLPDLIVTVQADPDTSAWREARAILAPIQRTALHQVFASLTGVKLGSANSPTVVSNGVTRNLRFLESDVIGHPLGGLTSLLPQPIKCRPATTRLKPYYQSVLDSLAWREPLLTDALSPQTWMPGQAEIGQWPTQVWGAVYPRSGWLHQPSPAKAAAVIAHRAVHVAVGADSLRIRVPLSAGSLAGLPPQSLLVNDRKTGCFQMLHPRTDNHCAPFGSADPTWDHGRTGESHAFIWNVWRRYKCCPRRGVFLYDIEF